MLDISDVEQCSMSECWTYQMCEQCSMSECWTFQMLSGAVCLNAGHVRC